LGLAWLNARVEPTTNIRRIVAILFINVLLVSNWLASMSASDRVLGQKKRPRAKFTLDVGVKARPQCPPNKKAL